MKFEDIPLITEENKYSLWNKAKGVGKSVDIIIGRHENGVVVTTHHNLCWSTEPGKLTKEGFEQLLSTYVDGKKVVEEHEKK